MTALAIGEPSLGGQINEIRVGGYDVDLDPGEPESSSASASSAPATRTMRGSRMPVGATKRTGPAPDESLERGGVRFVATETIAEASITKCHARSSRCGYRATRQVHATERSLSTSWMAAVLLTPWRRASSLGRRRSSGLMLRDRRAALSTFAMRSTHIVAGPER